MTSPFVTNDAVELIEGDVMIGTPVLAGKQVRIINLSLGTILTAIMIVYV